MNNPVTKDTTAFRSGFVAIVGRPNVGKSTLMNRILGSKLAIVSPKPQTTRNRIMGVKTSDAGQLILLDTPGLHEWKSPNKLNRYMVRVAQRSCRDVDAVLFMTDVHAALCPEDQSALKHLRGIATPVLLILNKIDLAPKSELLALIDTCRHAFDFHAIVPLSALKGDNVERLEEAILQTLPEGPAYFPADALTDQPDRFLVGELIREQLVKSLHDELPYATAVVIETFREQGGEPVRIEATIIVERESQKGIVIGKAGHTIKHIGESARREIGRFLGSDVTLHLWVKVKRNWSHSDAALRDLGYLET